MFRLESAHKFMAKRSTTQFPQLFAPYSHRRAKDGSTLNDLRLTYEGEELVIAAVARGRMKIKGEILAEAERFLDENPDGMFAVVETPYGGRVPFLYLKEPPQSINSVNSS
jgi:hypothetical protein